MTNHKEILRLKNLGIDIQQIAESCTCSRSTVSRTLKRAAECNLNWETAKEWQNSEVSILLYPTSAAAISYQTPDCAYLHTEMSKSGVTLNLLWVEYCDQCHLTGEIPYKSTQF